jgi:type IV pilus assembly protein PilC
MAETGSGFTMNERELVFFTRQLAALLRAGLPMLQAFDILMRGNRWSEPANRLIADMRRDIGNGQPLSAALGKHPRQIDALYFHLVRAGEYAGSLDAVLERIADYRESMLALKNRIKSAFYYPAFITVVALIIIAIVLASHSALDGGAALLFLGRYGLLVLVLPIGAAWGLFRAWKTSPDFRRRIERILLNTPVFSELVRQSALARWSRTLSTLYAAGVPLIDALEQASNATGSPVYDEAVRHVWIAVEGGASLSEAVNASRLFPADARQMIATGEATGALDTLLARLADHHEREVNTTTTALTRLLTPLATVIMGIVVGVLVIWLYMLSNTGM